MRKVGICKSEERDYTIVYSQAETTIAEWTLGELLNAIKRGKIIDNIPIQRDANQWSVKDKSMLIHTILINLSIIPVSLTQKGTGAGAIRLLIDGKQRLSTCRQFRDNEFPLSKATPPVMVRRIVKEQKVDEDGNLMFEKVGKKQIPVMIPCLDEAGEPITEVIEYKIAGKFYDELPDDLKMQFDTYSGMKQLIHVNYTEEEYQMQMLRDNISAKMTPAQTGVVLCGEDLADWLHSFRYENLFLNCSKWSESQVCKSLIERCVIESFILGMLEGKWYKKYEQNVELFKAHAMTNALDAYKNTIIDFGEMLNGYPQLKEYLTNKNMNVIIAAYQNFCDMDIKYTQKDFGDFLCKWFEEIKDSTDYEIEGNTGTKLKTTVLGKLAIIIEECEKYMQEYGTVESIANNNKVIADFENSLADTINLSNDNEKNAFNNRVLMVTSDYPYGDCNENTVEGFREHFDNLTPEEQANVIDNAELYSDCLNDYLVEIPSNSKFITADNLICLLNVVKKIQEDDVPDSTFVGWLKEFVSKYTDDCEYAKVREDQANYIMGRISILYNSLEKYQVEREAEEN